MTEQNGRIYWIGGSKGGVGKSMMTVATLDYVLERGDKALLIECDTSNPDVWKAYKTRFRGAHRPRRGRRLDSPREHLRQSSDTVIVVNTAARNNVAVKQYGQTLDSSLEELGPSSSRSGLSIGRETAWSSSRSSWTRFECERACRAKWLLRRRAQVRALQRSKIRESIESRGGKSVTFPDLATSRG